MNKIYYVIAKHDDAIYNKYTKKSMVGKKPIIIEDSPELNSMTKKYNAGLKRIKNLKDDDIVVFLHEDITILDNLFEGRLLISFASYPDIGVLGVYGSQAYIGGGWWSYDRNHSVGAIKQMSKDGTLYEMRHALPPNTINTNMVVVDGCIMAIRGKCLKQVQFDESMKGYHQYDNSYCLEVLLKTKYKLAVSDLNIFHASEGSPDETWLQDSLSLINRYKELGLHMPLTSRNIKEVNYGKVQ